MSLSRKAPSVKESKMTKTTDETRVLSAVVLSSGVLSA